MTAFQTVEYEVCTQRRRLDADKFPVMSGGPGKDFVADWISVGLSRGLLP